MRLIRDDIAGRVEVLAGELADQHLTGA